MPPRSSSSSWSSQPARTPASRRGRTDKKKTAREGGPARYRARVEYDGTEFAGFQAQPGRRTVQGELERVLAHLNEGRRVPISSAGRTDAGVHATGQVIAFTWPGDMPGKKLGQALGALLPRDVAIGPLRRVARDFDPRRAATRRTYRYTIWTGPRSPLRERHAYGLEEHLDVEAMRSAASHLVGEHDFSAFGRVREGAVRTVFEVRLRRRGHLLTIDVIGDAFLRQMVRSIVAALIRIGMGRATAEELVNELRGPGRAFAGAVAPPHGLCLRRVSMDRRMAGPPHRQDDEGTSDRGHEQDIYAKGK